MIKQIKQNYFSKNVFSKKHFLKNKRADVPVMILVLGVLAICGLALLSFYSASSGVSGDFQSIELIEKMNSISEEIRFYSRNEFEGLGQGVVFDENNFLIEIKEKNLAGSYTDNNKVIVSVKMPI